jgi:hypothetical protein
VASETWPEEGLGRKKHLTRRARIDAARRFASASRVQFDGRHDQTFVLADDGARRLPLAWRVHAFCWCRVRRLADLGRRHAEGCSTAAGRSGLRRVHGAPAAPGRSAKCGAEHCRGARHHRCRCADWRSSWYPGHDRCCGPCCHRPGHNRRGSASRRQIYAAAAAGAAASSLRPSGRSQPDAGWIILDPWSAHSRTGGNPAKQVNTPGSI